MKANSRKSRKSALLVNSARSSASIESGTDNPDASSTVIETRFAKTQSALNPRRQQLVRAILDTADETCFLSCRELAKRYRVDATTILCSTRVLGYQSYSDFAMDLRQHFVSRITPYSALKAATREKRSVADHIDHALEKALDNTNALKSDLDRKRIVELAQRIKRSRRVLVVGLDFAATLAYYLATDYRHLGLMPRPREGAWGTCSIEWTF